MAKKKKQQQQQGNIDRGEVEGCHGFEKYTCQPKVSQNLPLIEDTLFFSCHAH